MNMSTKSREMDFEGFIEPTRTRSFVEFPFQVPANTIRIDISYFCDPGIGRDEVVNENWMDYYADMILFDERGAHFGTQGFRGSCGNVRQAVFVAIDDATPGYYPGPLHPGEWTVVLGFFKMSQHGTHYRLKVVLTTSDVPAPETYFPSRLPLRAEAPRPANSTGWYKGELHCHTFHTDGDSDPREVVAKAEEIGLDFLAVTDHNTFSHQMVLNQVESDVILIPGCEVTTFQGHWNIWGDGPWIECRVMTAEEMSQTMKDAVQSGYLASCNHPRQNGPDWMFPEAEGYICVEVWNGPWESNNYQCLAFWEERIKQGKRLVAVGGSDMHAMKPNFPDERLGQPTTFIYCPGEPSAVALLAALRQGHAFITCLPDGPQLYLSAGSAMMGDVIPLPESKHLMVDVRIVGGSNLQLEILTAQGAVELLPITETEITVSCDVDVSETPYVRAQLRDLQSGYMKAISNPIYIDTSK